MKRMKTLLIGLALVAGTCGIAAAQDRDGDRGRVQWGYQDRDHDRDGRRGDGDYDRDDGYRNNPYYRTGMQQARQNGYQWGLRDGQVDRQAGRSYRATSNETFRHATIGYVSAYGDKNQYKSVFRQAYQSGYERGYGSGGYRGPWGR